MRCLKSPAGTTEKGIEGADWEFSIVPEVPVDHFQSSLQDFSSLEFLPRTASWAKFSRPCGTHLVIGGFSPILISRNLTGDEPAEKSESLLLRRNLHYKISKSAAGVEYELMRNTGWYMRYITLL
jgi:hypothetical protein